MTAKPITAARTAPKEKKTDSAVTRYCLPFGICSRRSVPSVGMEPYVSDFRRVHHGLFREIRTPTALPSRNRARQSHAKVPAKAAKTPNTDVRKSVALNAVVRPMRSEPVLEQFGRNAMSEETSTHKFPIQQLQTSSRRT